MKTIKSKKIILSISTIIILFITSIVIMGTFMQIQHKIRRQIFRNYMEQIDELSSQIINTIHLEIQYSAHFLKSIAETLKINPNDIDKSLSSLKELKNKANFQVFGIIDSNGNSFSSDGKSCQMNLDTFFKKMNFLENNEGYYISDVISENNSKEIIIAVPLYNNKKEIDGILFGYYPIFEIAEEINVNEKDYQFFQLVDTNGNYISQSSNENAFKTEDKSLWEKMKKFTFLKGNTIEKIKQNVQEGKKGIFSFEYNDNVRYVVYNPLKINNWYVFSIFTRNELEHRAKEFQKISQELLFYLINLKVILVAFIVSIAIYIYKIIEKQNKNIELKNKMFKMLANKTKDIFFEIHISENIFILYNFSKENEEILIPLEKVSPENMLKENHINKENYNIYKELYTNVFQKQNIENFIIQLNIDNVWKWFRVNSVIFNSENIIGVLEDFTEEKKQEFEFLKISEKSKYDFLTKLYNRETFETEFNYFLEKYKDENKVTAFFIVDLDNFKEINDIFGHRVGDKILSEVAKILKTSVRSTDLLGRLGGDEFILLIENATNIEAIHKIAQKLNSSLTKTYTKDNKNITIRCSIGISIISDNISFKKAYENADKALYHVKYNGRNSYFINS